MNAQVTSRTLPATPHIVVAIPFTASERATVEAAAPAALFAHSGKDVASDDDVALADIVMGNLPPRQLALAKNLQWVQLASAGADAYMAPGKIPPNVTLTNCVGAYGQAVSEHMLAMLLSLMKNLPLYRDNQRGHVWQNRGAVTTLVDANVVVLGLGDIGGHFARLVSALGAHVIGVRRHASAPMPESGVQRIVTMDQLPQILPQADVVASFLPGGIETHHMLGAAFFASMKHTSYFLNGGRGSVVDTDAVRDALVNGRLAGAGLDVTDPEPLPAEDSLWDVPNALITPHIAGGYQLPQTLENVAAICAGNLRHFLANEPLRNTVR
ncbi:MAG: D-2-hydroxyacid dehydrogenase [Bifidobacteriaceae bacterium]|jgi:phosphoglycerate dehydrogenase-like enzyme|nr:D-2-hydroxyacid dehydrogenase [Bifidobacteriaceae bacterium]